MTAAEQDAAMFVTDDEEQYQLDRMEDAAYRDPREPRTPATSFQWQPWAMSSDEQDQGADPWWA